MANQQFEYRCTRSVIYHHLPEPQRSDVRNRNGHYIVASGPAAALLEMKRRFPQDVVDAQAGGYAPFPLQLWKSDV